MSVPERGALSKSQQAYEVIKQRIVAQDYSPGYRLVLHPIAEELGMSVVPVREAIRRLEAEDLVTFERHVGAHVAMFDDSEYRYSMQTLGLLEGSATALAARRLSPDDLARARRVNDQMTDSLDNFDPHTFTEQNRHFHRLLYAPCSNPRLLTLVRAEWDRLGNLRDSTFAFVPGRARESVREHEQILGLIEQRAPLERIEAAARRHRKATLDAYLEHEHPVALGDDV